MFYCSIIKISFLCAIWDERLLKPIELPCALTGNSITRNAIIWWSVDRSVQIWAHAQWRGEEVKCNVRELKRRVVISLSIPDSRNHISLFCKLHFPCSKTVFFNSFQTYLFKMQFEGNEDESCEGDFTLHSTFADSPSPSGKPYLPPSAPEVVSLSSRPPHSSAHLLSLE